MTRDEIMAMQPGRELDMLVCREVMFPDQKNEPIMQKPSWCSEFSTTISAAWEVVEKLRKDSLNLNIYMYTFGCLTYVSTSKGLALQEVKCDTAPEAICKAALLAVMEEANT